MTHRSLPNSRSALLATRARQMRCSLTPSEAALWQALSGRRLGVQFRRQVPLLGRFIADFCASEVRLVVEVDGAYHERREAKDAQRDKALRLAGYTVLRVSAELVLERPSEAVALVGAAIAALRGGP